MGDQKTDHTATADANLVLRARSGDTEAFGELWRRHYPSGLTVARSITSSIDPDDLVQEAYARIYQAILKGGGPNGSFRAYLFTSIRNTAAAWGRARREVAIDELDSVADPDTTDSATEEALDRGLTAHAFRSLPSRWQEVLWYSEIEQMKPAEIAPLLGMTAGAVSQLTFRAREGLREAWIQAHLRTAGEGSECRWTIDHLGAHSRGNLGPRAQNRADAHLASCARCMIVAAEAKDVSGRLAIIMLPLVLGVGGASSYLASLQGGGTPIVALAAMPSGIVEGGIVAATGGAAALSGAAGGGSAAGTGGSSVGGMGALIGAGSAALVVAGVVAAVAVVPALTTAGIATSPPSASESETSIASEVSPDTSMSLDEPMVIEVDDPEPVAPAPAPGPRAVAPAEPAEDLVTPPPAPATPTPSPVPTPSPEPTPPPQITDPGDETDPPSEIKPGPTDELTWGQATVTGSVYAIPVQGTPGATVQVQIRRIANSRADQVTLDASGRAIAEIRPNKAELSADALVGFRYVRDGVPGAWKTTTLSSLRPAGAATEKPAEEAATSGDPAPAPAEPTQAPATLAPAPAEPTTAPVEPMTAPVEPTQAPAVPTEPAVVPVEPTLAPTEPAALPSE